MEEGVPGLPLEKGQAGTMTHDYKLHGTTTLFAAFDMLEGKVIGRCIQRHRHQEFISVLNRRARCRGRHPRLTFHFTPTSASWHNAVEGFFAILNKRRLKRGVFKGVVYLQAAINRFIVDHTQLPKPFVWTADPGIIIAVAARGHQVLTSVR